MKILQEIIIREEYVDFNENFPGFRVKFQDKIDEFVINTNCEFEINLKDEFKQDEKLQQKIIIFIGKIYPNIKLSFIPDNLPF